MENSYSSCSICRWFDMITCVNYAVTVNRCLDDPSYPIYYLKIISSSCHNPKRQNYFTINSHCGPYRIAFWHCVIPCVPAYYGYHSQGFGTCSKYLKCHPSKWATYMGNIIPAVCYQLKITDHHALIIPHS